MAFSPYISDLEEEVAVETAIWRPSTNSKRQQNSGTQPSAIVELTSTVAELKRMRVELSTKTFKVAIFSGYTF